MQPFRSGLRIVSPFFHSAMAAVLVALTLLPRDISHGGYAGSQRVLRDLPFCGAFLATRRDPSSATL
jgi:hypothetical protein